MANNKVFANKIDKKINNNNVVFYGAHDEIKDVVSTNHTIKNINQKVNDIFKSKNYVYKADVIITTKNGDAKKRIIGRNKNNLITADNELIPITDLLDIKWQ